jgi:hypothetical protein
MIFDDLVQCSLAQLTSSIDVGTVFDQELHNFHAIVATRHVQSGSILVIAWLVDEFGHGSRGSRIVSANGSSRAVLLDELAHSIGILGFNSIKQTHRL